MNEILQPYTAREPEAHTSSNRTDASRHPRPARPWLAALLSVLQPGLGHLYLWRPRMALAAFAAWALAVAVGVWAFLRLPGLAALLLGVLCGLTATILIARHAYRLARSSRLAVRPARWALLVALVAFYAGASVLHGFALDWTKANVAQAFRIPSGAMEPTILVGDYLFIAPRRGSPPGRDSLVVFNGDGASFIKRVVGLPGDTLQMRDARLYRNARPVVEPYARADSSRDTASTDFDWQRTALVAGRDTSAYRASVDDWGPLVVPPGHMFVLGDNRHNSLDSRYIGFVATDDVLGVPRSVYFSRDPEAKRVRWERIGRRIE